MRLAEATQTKRTPSKFLQVGFLIPLQSLPITWGFTQLLKEQKDPSSSCYRSKEAFGSAKSAKILTHINAENELVKTEQER